MKKPEREYPDIEFLETDTETIESNMIALYEELVNKELVKQGKREKYKVYPASPERLFIAWCAAIIVQQRVLINETAKKNVPRYAKGNYLDSLAELFKDIKRLPATPAMAKFRCYISMAQNQSVIIPKGTRITFDGEIIFETTEELEIKTDGLGKGLGIIKRDIETGKTIQGAVIGLYAAENIKGANGEEIIARDTLIEKVTTDELGRAKYTLQRSKGLGENEPDMMWETTMNPATRRLIQISEADAEKTAKIFDTLLGDDLPGRKEFITLHGHEYLSNADI